MTYTLARLAPGSYDVILKGEVLAALVLSPDSYRRRPKWIVELLDAECEGSWPTPFEKAEHEFGSFAEACAWLRTKPPP